MNIALLKCGSVHPNHSHLNGDYEDMFKALLLKNAPSISLTIFDFQKGEYPPKMDEFDGFISTGSANSVYDEIPWIIDFKNFTKELFKKKCKHVGICFGHQMIADALGGKVVKSDKDWGVGIKTLYIKNTVNWLANDSKKEINLIVSHQDQVVKLPEGATVIAGNDHCPNGIFTIEDHILGIQAHPEFTNDYAATLMESRRNIIKPELIKWGLESLKQKSDSDFIAKGIENFLKS